jgi:hypothetical protein
MVEIDPSYKLNLLIVGKSTGNFDIDDRITVYFTSDLIQEVDLHTRLHSYYNLLELSTALKPFFLEMLLAKGFSSVLYIDPDMKLFNRLDHAFELTEASGIALTPHRLQQPSAFTNFYSDDMFLRAGAFNLGFIGVSSSSIEMLRWWKSRLQWYCTSIQPSEFFTDQKWMDLVPIYFPYAAIRHPGYNVAPWNLDERIINLKDQALEVNGQPLVLIHFAQMSAALRDGDDKDLWSLNSGNPSPSNDSLKQIQNITSVYAKQLQEKKFALQDVPFLPEVNLDKSYAGVLRLILKNRYLMANLEDRNYVPSSILKTVMTLLTPLVNLVSRSNAARGFLLGLLLDISRFSRGNFPKR